MFLLNLPPRLPRSSLQIPPHIRMSNNPVTSKLFSQSTGSTEDSNARRVDVQAGGGFVGCQVRHCHKLSKGYRDSNSHSKNQPPSSRIYIHVPIDDRRYPATFARRGSDENE